MSLYSRSSSGPLAFVNNRLMPFHEAHVSIVDDGIVSGATITERLRTFAHRPYLLDDHLRRLQKALLQTGVADESIVNRLSSQIDRLVDCNARFIAEWQDLAVVIFVTPGINSSFTVGASNRDPTVVIHTSPIPVPQWRNLATDGVRLVTPSVRQIPPVSLDPQIKTRSRMHWFLAEREVRKMDPGAAALLLNDRGFVTETSSGNLMIFDGQRLLTPRAEETLDGISRRIVFDLAKADEIETMFVDLKPADVIRAEEAFLTSSGYCLLPVVRLNGQAIGSQQTGRPGPLWRRLLEDWSKSVGVDILAQHLRATTDENP